MQLFDCKCFSVQILPFMKVQAWARPGVGFLKSALTQGGAYWVVICVNKYRIASTVVCEL